MEYAGQIVDKLSQDKRVFEFFEEKRGDLRVFTEGEALMDAVTLKSRYGIDFIPKRAGRVIISLHDVWLFLGPRENFLHEDLLEEMRRKGFSPKIPLHAFFFEDEGGVRFIELYEEDGRLFEQFLDENKTNKEKIRLLCDRFHISGFLYEIWNDDAKFDEEFITAKCYMVGGGTSEKKIKEDLGNSMIYRDRVWQETVSVARKHGVENQRDLLNIFSRVWVDARRDASEYNPVNDSGDPLATNLPRSIARIVEEYLSEKKKDV